MKMGQRMKDVGKRQTGCKLRKQLIMRGHEDSEAESQRVIGQALEHLSVSGDMVTNRDFVPTPFPFVLMWSFGFLLFFSLHFKKFKINA